MKLADTYMTGELVRSLIGAARWVLLVNLPLAILVTVLVIVVAVRRQPLPRTSRRWLELLALVHVIGAVITILVDLMGALTAPWEFRYLADQLPEALIFVYPVGVVTAPLWLALLRHVEPDALLSVAPRS